MPVSQEMLVCVWVAISHSTVLPASVQSCSTKHQDFCIKGTLEGPYWWPVPRFFSRGQFDWELFHFSGKYNMKADVPWSCRILMRERFLA